MKLYWKILQIYKKKWTSKYRPLEAQIGMTKK
jgi:hypothetical protein